MPKVEIFKEICKSCGYCIKFCPKSVLEVGEDVNMKGYQYTIAKRMDQCIGCKMCAIICPDAVIEVYK